jgi:hypothetical protein
MPDFISVTVPVMFIWCVPTWVPSAWTVREVIAVAPTKAMNPVKNFAPQRMDIFLS